MRILAIDTSTMISTVTISEDERIIGDFNVNQQKTHSESLVPMIETLLKLLGLEISDIDYFCISQGPGSFTGLRIGMAVAKTLAQVEGKKLIPISTLKALATNDSSEKIKIPLIDARGGRVYGAAFDKDLGEIIPEDLYQVEDLAKKVNDLGLPVNLIGEVAEKYRDLFDQAKALSFNYSSCIGRGLVKLASEKLDFDYPFFELVPNYLRKSQAEMDREK